MQHWPHQTDEANVSDAASASHSSVPRVLRGAPRVLCLASSAVRGVVTSTSCESIRVRAGEPDAAGPRGVNRAQQPETSP